MMASALEDIHDTMIKAAADLFLRKHGLSIFGGAISNISFAEKSLWSVRTTTLI